MRNKQIAYIGIVLLMSITSFGQSLSKVLMKPEKFEGPVAYEGESKVNFENLKSDKGDIPWFVVCDRANNKTFRDRDEHSDTMNELTFGEGFYVTKEKGEWIRIGKPANPDDYVNDKRISLIDYGWIKKEKMLLWNNSLLDPVTRIHLKGFLLNKAKDFERKKLDKVYFYHSPELKDKTAEGELDLYNFYFIYKIEYHEGGNNNRYLLGTGSIYNPFTSPENLKGWVDQRRIDQWNTRIALAPNFQQEAFNERKENLNLRVRGYSQYRDCRKVATETNEYFENVLWDNDPVIIKDASRLGRTNNKRFNKDIIRFPIIGYEPNSNYYRSGVIATHGGVDASISQRRKDASDEIVGMADVMNVVFLFDGSSTEVGNHKRTAINLIDKIKSQNSDKTVKIGVGVYKDVSDKGSVYKYVPLNQNTTEAVNLINTTLFGSVGEYDGYTCVGNGIRETLLKANFQENESNVLIQFGDQPDITKSKLRESDFKKYGAKKSTLRKLVREYGLHWLVMDVNYEDDIESDHFQEHIRDNLMNNFVKEIYSEANSIAQQSLNKTVSVPILPELNDGEEMSMTDFHCVYGLLKPKGINKLTSQEIERFVLANLQIINAKVDRQVKAAKDFVDKGIRIDPSSGKFTSEVIPILLKSLGKESGKILTPAEQKALLTEIQGEKFYSEVFLPTQIKEAGYKPYSYVLFMPKEDLVRYNGTMRNIEQALLGTEDQNRQALENLMTELAEQLSGETNYKKIESMTIDDISDLLQGIAKEGYNVERNFNVKIKHIRNRKIFKSDKLKEFSRSIVKKHEILSNILKNDDYEFKYVNDNTYYWIPMTNVF